MLQSLCVKKLESRTATSRPWHLHSTGCKNVFENLTSFNISTRITMSRHFEVQLIIFFFGIIHNFDVILPLVIWTDKVYLLLAKWWNFETVFTFFSAGWRSGSSRAHTHFNQWEKSFSICHKAGAAWFRRACVKLYLNKWSPSFLSLCVIIVSVDKA